MPSTELGQEDWLNVVQDMTTALPYSDGCSGRPGRRSTCDPLPIDQRMYAPFRTDIKDGWLVGTYRCGRCGDVWTCGYALDAPTWF